MTFTIDTRELDDARAGLAAFDELAGDAAEPLVDESARAALDAVRSRASRHRRTGRMVRQIRTIAEGDGLRRRAVVRAGGSIAPIIAGGSVAHNIRPARARALQLGGALRFASSVRHPGTRPDPFVLAGLTDASGQIDRDADAAADRLADRLADRIAGG